MPTFSWEGGTHALRSQARFAQGTATEGSASRRTPEVTDPSQVPMPCGHHRGMKMPPKRPPRDLFHRKLRMTVRQGGSTVILREERPKDPLPVTSVGVADPSQAQDDSHA